MNKEYDVVILGSGISGSILAAILARHNLKVAMVDSAVHPRFSVGESTGPETTMNLLMMAHLYDVPELEDLSSFVTLRDKIGASHGVKKAFSFSHHKEGKLQNPKECTQTATGTPPLGPDSHWFRQDVDQYMMTVAVGYGADIYQSTTVDSFDMSEDEVTLNTNNGVFKAGFIFDASGSFSPFAKELGIREETTRLKTHSRGLFTHMTGVRSWEEFQTKEEHGMEIPFYQSTHHHLFDGGWMWVIPFDNHADASNNMCSVGVMFDCRDNPRPDMTPEEEFQTVLEKFPSLKMQFADAKSVRPWVSSNRIQYSSHTVYKDRYFALPHAAAFIDPLFSSGLILTTHTVCVVADIMLDSFKKGEILTDRFQEAEAKIQQKIDILDELVYHSYTGFKSFELWNAWYRLWETGAFLNILGSISSFVKYLESKDPEVLRNKFNGPYGKALGFGQPEYADLFENCCSIMTDLESGKTTEAEAVDKIYMQFQQLDQLPEFASRRDRNVRTIGAMTAINSLRFRIKGKAEGAANTQHYYDYSILPLTWYSLKYNMKYLWCHLRKLPLLSKLNFFGWSEDQFKRRRLYNRGSTQVKPLRMPENYSKDESAEKQDMMVEERVAS